MGTKNFFECGNPKNDKLLKKCMRIAVIVIPTYNEASNIKNLLQEIFSLQNNLAHWKLQILVVDSKSPDNTASIVKNFQKINKNIFLIQTSKEGLGKAYSKGFQYALNNLDPYVLFEMDADLSHDPKKIPEFLKKIEEGADFVIGTRYSKGGSIPKDWSFKRKLFSILGNIIIKFGFAKPMISDWTSGYRAIKSWVVKRYVNKVDNYSGYVFQVATLNEALKNNAQVKEIPIHFTDRIEGISKINSTQFITQTLLYVFSNSSFIKYAVVGGVSAIIDFSVSFAFIEVIKFSIWLSTLISVETSIIFNFLMNNFWSFSHKKLETKKHTYASSFLKFNLIQSISLFIQLVGIQMFAGFFGEKYWYIYKFFILAFIIVPLTYFLYNKFIWKSKGKKS
ncbi:MAG: glycosyltransferase [bacterium]